MKHVLREFYKSGKLWHVVIYINGQKHGIEEWYYENGTIQFEIPYVHGWKHGICKCYETDGRLKYTIYYWYGKRITKKQWKSIPRLTKVISGIEGDNDA